MSLLEGSWAFIDVHDMDRIILYAITGCVSGLFIVVILSGVGSIRSDRTKRITSDYLISRLSVRYAIPNGMALEHLVQTGEGSAYGGSLVPVELVAPFSTHFLS